jgi:hypothetical protein
VLRFIARTIIALIANAFGLIVAAWILDDMTLSASGFLLEVAIFTGVVVIIQPFIAKSAMRNSSSLMGASAVLAAFVGLIVTVWLSDGLRITGTTTWLLATMIVWLASLLAGVLLPMLMFKKWLAQSNANR